MKTIVLAGLLLHALSTGSVGQTTAMQSDYRNVGKDVKYRYIGQYSVERLNKITGAELAQFSAFPMTFPPAENAVKLYKVIYQTVVPEDSRRAVRLSGLIAVPAVGATRLPIVSYQHGTVFSRSEVPSSIEESMETRIMVARFAGHGYVVIGADYVGKGISTEPDGWLVKDVTAQACLDMLIAARAVLADMHITTDDLFLSGWSQGSFSTGVLLNRLEQLGAPVKAAAMASSPNDIYLCVNRWIHVPSDLDVNWLVGAASLLVNSYEHYYQLPGLSKSAIKPQYWQAAHDLFHNKATWAETAKRFPATTKDLFQADFENGNSQLANRFFEQLQRNNSYQWRFKTPTRYYYGLVDEVVTPYMVQLPVEYQQALGGAPARAVFAGEKADHRGTFVFAVNDQKQWFDTLRRQ